MPSSDSPAGDDDDDDGHTQSGEPAHVTGDWRGAVPGVDYHCGQSTGSAAVTAKLTLRSNFSMSPIWNVVTIIPGDLDPEHVVVLGNHRDAWVRYSTRYSTAQHGTVQLPVLLHAVRAMAGAMLRDEHGAAWPYAVFCTSL